MGYVSADFREHSVAYFVAPLWAAHDRAVLEVHGYANLARPDAVTERLASLADVWHPVAGLDDDALTAQVRADGIDILVDLAGHTGGNRLAVFARRPAPIQIIWLGYPNTTGLAAMGYFLTDAEADPDDKDARLFSERLLRMEGCAHCYEGPGDAPEVTPPPLVRRRRPTFGSFNNPAKASPRTVALWARTLAAVPQARFVMKGRALADAASRARFHALFAAAGIEAARVELLPRMDDRASHLAAYGDIDIALDCLDYSGVTTTCEALWMEVPVLTLPGARHAARVGASLLRAAGLDELVARDADDFVARAAALAADRARLAGLRTRGSCRLCPPHRGGLSSGLARMVPGPRAVSELAAFVRAIPKAELHLHIEGTLEPAQLLALAARNRVALPYDNIEAVRAAYAFPDLQAFLDLYYRGMDVLCETRDFYELTWAYLERARADGVRHAEIFFDAQAHTGRGVALATVVDGIGRALDDGRARLGITSRLILCFLRDRGEAEALATLDAALDHRERIAGVGLDSTERGHPPGKFARVFDRARAAGFRCVAHAGEEGPAAYVREALDVLQVERIDHGVSAIEDPALLARLARDGVPLTMCPVSNLRLGVVADLARHPLKAMLEAGLKVTVNADDPAYFGAYVADNYLGAARALGLDRTHIATLARNSIEAAFLAPAERAALLATLDAFLAREPAA